MNNFKGLIKCNTCNGKGYCPPTSIPWVWAMMANRVGYGMVECIYCIGSGFVKAKGWVNVIKAK